MSEKTIAPASQVLPNKLHLISLTGHPIFPGIFTPVMINSPEDISVIEEVSSGDSLIGMCLLKSDAKGHSVEEMHQVGTVARIVKKIKLPDGGVNIFVSTIKRFRVKKILNSENPAVVSVEYLEDEESDPSEIKALARALLTEMRRLADGNPLLSEEAKINIVNMDQSGKIADFIASILDILPEEQQQILETVNVRRRMEKVLVFIKKEQELLSIQKKIQREINDKIDKNQREFFLREELKLIKEELGISGDSKAQGYQKFKSIIEGFNFQGEIKEVVDSELEKFSIMEPNSSEYMVTRNYLEIICSLPWADKNEFQDIDVASAKVLLDKEHYGMEDVKKRVIEYISVRQLKRSTDGSILILVGPPGVGKTSIGKSIAGVLNKKFFRFSVGGMRDEAEIKGHRRTYIGALPGKIIQGLKITGSKSPVFMIDEVDKIGNDYRGDPASALLEVLDPEQNSAFRDHYLDLPFDLSKIMFILTANSLDSIPAPLLDRAEVIRLSGYIDSEKAEIAKRYLIPKSLAENGLKKNQVVFNRKMLLSVANGYAREAGVRGLEKNIDKISRKIAAEIVSGEKKPEEKTLITPELLVKYLGKPVFPEDETKKAEIPGTSIGLAWTSMGGDTLMIEAVNTDGKGGLELTGQMGEVMKESASIAFTWAKKYVCEKKGFDSSWFEKHDIHLHIPEGATPKDGPSAGITMATALTSLLTGKSIKPGLAMTGELSLTGQVMAIGGLKEKTIAAHRSRIKEIIIPKDNIRDLDEIPDYVKKDIKFIPLSRMEDVADYVFGYKSRN